MPRSSRRRPSRYVLRVPLTEVEREEARRLAELLRMPMARLVRRLLAVEAARTSRAA